MGRYTRFDQVLIPASAVAGENVPIAADVVNLDSKPIYISLAAEFDSSDFLMYPDYALVAPGETSFGGFFVMPSKAVRVTLYLYYWDGNDWILDGQLNWDVSLQQAAPLFSELTASYAKA